MHPNEYQKACLRTEADPSTPSKRITGLIDEVWLDRTEDGNSRNVRLLHALCGLSSETGEVATLLKKHIFYGQPLDKAKVGDECGDILWYISLALDAVGLKLEDVMASNIRKLQVRFPDKFSEDLARDEARDREAEGKAMNVKMGEVMEGFIFKDK